jgi:hypothetical protein
LLFAFLTIGPQIARDFAELFKGGFAIVPDSLGEHAEIGETVGFFEAFVTEPAEVMAGK